ncbi:autophagy protein 6 [Chytriomyces hyalinus]|nr:autophagy protein 6 [Chytriomyces hyalinus]
MILRGLNCLFSLTGSDAAAWVEEKSQNSFVVLNESEKEAPGSNSLQGTKSEALRVAGRVLGLIERVAAMEHIEGPDPNLSGGAYASNPSPSTATFILCSECADSLAITLEQKLAHARKERDAYAGHLSMLKSAASPSTSTDSHSNSSSPTDASINANSDTDLDNDSALAELAALERESLIVQQNLADVERELEEIDAAEQEYWIQVNALQMHQLSIEEERDSLHSRLAVANAGLERLEKTNVYNDAFRIWHDGPFGTINGFRLGRLPNLPVEWNEINAALGQSLLLVDVLATKLGFIFKGYKLVPMGSFSRIEKIEGDKAAYELYGSNDFTVLLFWNRRFDNALVAFLQCIQQLGDFIQQRDSKLKLPYA